MTSNEVLEINVTDTNVGKIADGDRAVSLNAVDDIFTEMSCIYDGEEYKFDDVIDIGVRKLRELPSVSQPKINYGYIKKIAKFFLEWDGDENATLEFSVAELRDIANDHSIKHYLQKKVEENMREDGES